MDNTKNYREQLVILAKLNVIKDIQIYLGKEELKLDRKLKELQQIQEGAKQNGHKYCLLYTSPSPRD